MFKKTLQSLKEGFAKDICVSFRFIYFLQYKVKSWHLSARNWNYVLDFLMSSLWYGFHDKMMFSFGVKLIFLYIQKISHIEK